MVEGQGQRASLERPLRSRTLAFQVWNRNTLVAIYWDDRESRQAGKHGGRSHAIAIIEYSSLEMAIASFICNEMGTVCSCMRI
jgi:hypothetical protein